MTDLVTVTGYVATPPRHVVTPAGLPITTFRLVSQQRRFDRQQQKWVDGAANWYTIATFRRLAIGVNRSVDKGQHVIVTGRVRIRDWEAGERNGTTVEIEADAVGHDLSWGTATYTATPSASLVAERDASSPSPGDGAFGIAGDESAPPVDAATEPTAAEVSWAPAPALPF